MDNADVEARIPKRFKIDENSELVVPTELLHQIIGYICYKDVNSIALLLRSAKIFEQFLDEDSWKLLYLARWQNYIIGDKLDNSKDITEQIERCLAINHSNYIEEQFYDKKNAWKNRYNYLARLESEGPSKQIFKKNGITAAVYKINYDYDIKYGNAATIEAKNKKSILGIQQRRGIQNFQYDHPDEDKFEDYCTTQQYIVIGHTGAPLKIRVETIAEQHRSVEKMYCNARVVAFDTKNQVWNVFVAHYSNRALQEDETDYYIPCGHEVTRALFGEYDPSGRYDSLTSGFEEKLEDLFRLLGGVANVPQRHMRANFQKRIPIK